MTAEVIPFRQRSTRIEVTYWRPQDVGTYAHENGWRDMRIEFQSRIDRYGNKTIRAWMERLA